MGWRAEASKRPLVAALAARACLPQGMQGAVSAESLASAVSLAWQPVEPRVVRPAVAHPVAVSSRA